MNKRGKNIFGQWQGWTYFGIGLPQFFSFSWVTARHKRHVCDKKCHISTFCDKTASIFEFLSTLAHSCSLRLTLALWLTLADSLAHFCTFCSLYWKGLYPVHALVSTKIFYRRVNIQKAFHQCGKAYESSRRWFWFNICHKFFNVCAIRALTQQMLS